MTVRVTKKNIREGLASNNESCPIALALWRKHEDVSVDQIAIEFNGEYIMTPQKLIDFMEAFDSGKPVKPFQFTIKI